MLSEEQVGKVIESMSDDIPGFVAAALVDIDSGMTLGVFSVRSDFDLSAASAYNSELVKQKLNIMKALGLSSALEDVTMTLTDQIHMIWMIPSGRFVYLAADRETSNLAIMRNAIKAHETEFTG